GPRSSLNRGTFMLAGYGWQLAGRYCTCAVIFYPPCGMAVTLSFGQPCDNMPDRLRASDPDSNEEDQHTSDNHLKCCAEKWRIHIPLSDPANDQQFDCHDHNGNGRSSSKFWNQIWQRVTDSSPRTH